MADLYDSQLGIDLSFNDSISYEDDRISISSDIPPNSPNRPRSSGTRNGSFSSKKGSRRSLNGPGGGNGLGSLADELAGAWGDEYGDHEEDEEEGYEEGYEEGENGAEGGVSGGEDEDEGGVGSDANGMNDQHHGDYPSRRAQKKGIIMDVNDDGTLARRVTRDYDGSDYGDPEDLNDGISHGLQSRMDQVERLALTGHRESVAKLEVWAEDGGGDKDSIVDVIPRLMEGLQNLQPQSGLETSSTRLITAHSALASHMYHQTRTLRDLSFTLFSSPVLPEEDTTDLLTSLVDLIPRPNYSALAELSNLYSLTANLISQLSFLSDSLHMARQSSIAANRKLRVAKEACADWKSELEQAEKAKRWIEEGDWVGKCSRREAASVCSEVVEGFKENCRRYEQQMQAMLVCS